MSVRLNSINKCTERSPTEMRLAIEENWRPVTLNRFEARNAHNT